MYLRSGGRVSQLKLNNCLYAIYLMSVVSMMIGQVLCSDSDTIKKTPLSGSGSGASAITLQKRSSYAVLSQAMQETVNNEFGSEYKIERFIILSLWEKIQ